MERELFYYKSTYFKNKPLYERLLIRLKRFFRFNIEYRYLNLIGKFKYGWKYNGRDEPTPIDEELF